MRRIVFRRPAGRFAAAAGLARLPSRLHGIGRVVAAVATVGFLLLAADFGGFVQASDTSLVVMGFDPDRAQLITSLVVCAGAAAFAYLCSERFVTAVLLGLAAGTTLYAETFAQETTSAMASSGAAGVFDPRGWLLTLETLLLSGLVVAWSAATLSRPIRRELITAGQALIRAIRERRHGPRALGTPVVVGLVAVLLLVSAPTLGDMLNYSPNSHMLAGGPPGQGLGPGQASDPSPASAPWLLWKPSGQGAVVTESLPAPWVGGQTLDISVYLPPGYARSGRRYPVVYETVFSLETMDKAFNARSEIDTLIDEGKVPASVFVFINTSGGPYMDSECANSADGQEWMASFIGETVPAYVDAHYRTIAKRVARAVLGFSQGGYCAAMLALRYPEVFGNAISFSGYFHAGVGSSNSWRPFAHLQKLLDQFSPTVMAPQLPASSISGLYFVVDYDPSLPFEAREADEFIAVLGQSGYRYTVISSGLKHSWTEVREGLGTALTLVGSRQAKEHTFP
jgi:S-formylglutathione hydrolase FrmB